MEAEGRGGRRAPYSSAVKLTAEEQPRLADPKPAEGKSELVDPKPPTRHAPWIRPLSDYERRETTIVEGLRYG
jgi:hypothetical protein